MTTLVFIEAIPKAGKTEELAEFFKRNFHHARAYDGCHDAAAYVSADDGAVVVTQVWDSAAEFERYLGWRETAGSTAEFDALLQTEPVIRYFESR